MLAEKKHIAVVAAIVCYNDKILCMQRGGGKSPSTDFTWEFPGGKIEPGGHQSRHSYANSKRRWTTTSLRSVV